jgi:hypothetical protein
MTRHLPTAALLLMTFCPAVLVLDQTTAAAQPVPSKPPAEQAKPASALPLESVIVTATKPSEAAIKSFVETRAVPTYVLGRMARWDGKICPLTIGLGDTYAKYITQRIRDIATAAGAPVNADPTCRPNIEVVFTTTPQGLMDSVRKKQPLFLGFHHNSRQADELAKVTHSIQAWYTTETVDIDGDRSVDIGTCGPSGNTTLNTQTDAQTDTGGAATAGVHQLSLPCATVVHSTGSRARDGLGSGFFNVLIVAEPTKLFDYEVGSLADYITMLALSQPASLDSCQEMPSISNMLAPGCTSATKRITDADLAYLHALYKLMVGDFLVVQRDYIRDEMYKKLVTAKGD